ncbi:MAG TPA: hypothetical protein VFW96_16980 [Thermomicrobiales bacterium]|nr:hypothetical protein [Thermomicrobiales bacterium]
MSDTEQGWRQIARRVGAALRALFGPGLGATAGRYAGGAAFRDAVLTRYPFTDEARDLLRTVRFEVHNLNEPVGGGGWYGPQERRIVLEGIQDEAAVHELAHAWADLAGFYQERQPGGPPWPTLNLPFRAAVRAAADDPDPRYGRVQFLAHQYEYGDPAINFPGMDENDPERFAGLASGTMGDLRLMPPELAQWYAGLFQAG